MELIEWLQQISILNIFILKCQVLLGFEIIEIINYECEKEHFEVYSTADIFKTVCQVVNVFPSIQSFYKWLSAEEIWKARTAYLLRKWICKMLYVAHFGFSFKFLGGQKWRSPF